MTKIAPKAKPFNIFIIAQTGRLMYEALLFAASLRHSDPGFSGRLIIGQPEPGARWSKDQRVIDPAALDLFKDYGAELVTFKNQHFGQTYPYGNKIEGLACLPESEPFVFFDTDTLVTGPLSQVAFDFDRPSASMRREGTWPQIELYGPGYGETWKSLYDRFGLDFATSLDPSEPDEYWKRYLYFNAGWFFYRCPREFGARFTDWALQVRDTPSDTLSCQTMDPWLDQIVLPLVIHSFGGGRPGPELAGLDGDITCHYRTLPLLFARETDATIAVLEAVCGQNRLKKVLREYEPFKIMVNQNKGSKVRAMFDRNDLPRREQMIRNQIKAAGLWLR
jgi:hypothetical protein